MRVAAEKAFGVGAHLLLNKAAPMSVNQHNGTTAQTTNRVPVPVELLATVAICTRNRGSFLKRAIESVVPQLNPQAELLLVDNASTDDTAKIIAQAASNPRVRALREEELGISAARNTALLNSRGKFVIYLDDDARAEPGWLTAYQEFFSAPAADKIAVVGGTVIPDYDAAPPGWFDAGLYTYDLGPTPAQIFEHRGPWGCNIAYLRDAAIEAGMFDVRLGRKGTSLAAHEEMELDLRLEKAGFKVWWLPTARIRHFVAAERVRLTWQWRSEFEQSRSRGIMKLQARRKGARFRYGAGRILIAPIHATLNLLVASVMWPFNQREAAASFLRTARIAGVAAEVANCALGRRKL
jgi:glycosyltransferase involved in cell wall biosynthesis